jgi:hypothetical protein
MTETIICLRCGAKAEAQREGDRTQVPPGWRRLVTLTAGPGTWITDDDMSSYEIRDGMWLCPAHER